jgi:hypothetical protein
MIDILEAIQTAWNSNLSSLGVLYHGQAPEGVALPTFTLNI